MSYSRRKNGQADSAAIHRGPEVGACLLACRPGELERR